MNHNDQEHTDDDASKMTARTSANHSTSISDSSSGGGDSSQDYDVEEVGVERSIHQVPELIGGYIRRHTAPYLCLPYRKEIFRMQMDGNSPGSVRRVAILETLKSLDVSVFVVDGKECQNTGQLLASVKRVVGYIARENRVLQKSGPLGFQRALLYQDMQGRLFNLLISPHAVGPAETWKNYLDSFSGMEAMIALLILVRSFPCATQNGIVDTFRPAFLSLVLGLVLTEEMSLSWMNASMLVRACPSVSAHTLVCPVAPDTLRKLVIFVLALASAATGQTQLIMVLLGIGGACTILLANLGSRAWHFLRFQPQRYNWYGAGLLAYLQAIMTGIIFPYLGHRNILVGGKAAVEYVIRTSFLVALAFVVSNVDQVRQYIVVGSADCDQRTVNVVVSTWLLLTTVLCLCVVRRIPYVDQKPSESERLLEPDHSSPAGYRVPSLPDFEIDPSLAQTGLPCFSVGAEFAMGIIMAFAVSGAMIFLSYTTWDEALFETVNQTIANIA